MTNAASNMLKGIGAKWGRFSEQDLSALKNKDDLVTQVVAKYGLEKSEAQRDKIKATADWIQALHRRAPGEPDSTTKRRPPIRLGRRILAHLWRWRALMG
jgi:hypothetical protein